MDKRVILSKNAKMKLVEGFISDSVNILYAIEKEIVTGEDAQSTIENLLFEVNSMNALIDDELAKAVLILNGIKDQYKVLPYKPTIRKWVLDVRGIFDKYIENLKNSEE